MPELPPPIVKSSVNVKVLAASAAFIVRLLFWIVNVPAVVSAPAVVRFPTVVTVPPVVKLPPNVTVRLPNKAFA